MSAQPNDGGPAFPQVETTVHMTGSGEDGYTPLSDVHSVGGMSMRDYFAAKADMSRVEVNPELGVKIAGPIPDDAVAQVEWQASIVAFLRYKMADAMLKARGETP